MTTRTYEVFIIRCDKCGIEKWVPSEITGTGPDSIRLEWFQERIDTEMKDWMVDEEKDEHNCPECSLRSSADQTNPVSA